MFGCDKPKEPQGYVIVTFFCLESRILSAFRLPVSASGHSQLLAWHNDLNNRAILPTLGPDLIYFCLVVCFT